MVPSRCQAVGGSGGFFFLGTWNLFLRCFWKISSLQEAEVSRDELFVQDSAVWAWAGGFRCSQTERLFFFWVGSSQDPNFREGFWSKKLNLSCSYLQVFQMKGSFESKKACETQSPWLSCASRHETKRWASKWSYLWLGWVLDGATWQGTLKQPIAETREKISKYCFVISLWSTETSLGGPNPLLALRASILSKCLGKIRI